MKRYNNSLAAKLGRDNVSMRSSPTTVISYLSESQEEPKREIAEKLLRFREISKNELQKSWNEVESLHRNHACHVKIKAQLEKELKESESKQHMWRIRCLAAEAAVVQKSKEENFLCLDETTSFTERMHLNISRDLRRSDETHFLASGTRESQSIEKTIFSYIGMGARPIMGLANSIMPISLLNDGAVRNPIVSETDQSIQLYIAKKKQYQDLVLKISSRDLVITSLEQVLNEIFHHIQPLQLEMECLIEAQQIKEKKLSDTIIRKELWQEKLRKKVDVSDLCVKQREQNISETHSCIHDMASELQNLLEVVKIAEGRGFQAGENCSTFSPTTKVLRISSDRGQ